MAELLPETRFEPGTSGVPVSRIELSVSCKQLINKDVFSKSDPFCVLLIQPFNTNNYVEYDRSETIQDTLNPEFVKKFIIDYHFEENQKLKFSLYDSDAPNVRDLSRHDFLGHIECTLAEIVSSTVLTRPLNAPQSTKTNAGSITIRAEEISTCKDLITLEFGAKKLDKKDFFGKSDPFLVISRSNEDGKFTTVHRTETIKNNLNPIWKSFSVKAQTLCNGDYYRMLKFDIYDWNSSGSHELIGTFMANIDDLSKRPNNENIYAVINPVKKAKKKTYKDSGLAYLLNCKIEKLFSFVDYIQGGLQIHLTVAIDFTQSNGDPRSPQSLHYYTPTQQSQYGLAIQAIGEILKDYDTNKVFGGFGFGAKLPTGEVSHFFPLSLSNNPYSRSVAELLTVYYQCLQRIQLYGPTNFAPLIQNVSNTALGNAQGHYHILLIITDGIITDMQNTKRAIVEAASLPMSIIIVGVGEADFANMEELDGDEKRLQFQGRYAERDVVQFVPFKNFLQKSNGNFQTAKTYLAKAVLEEVPGQLTDYMKVRKIVPNLPNDKSNPTAPAAISTTPYDQPYQEAPPPYS